LLQYALINAYTVRQLTLNKMTSPSDYKPNFSTILDSFVTSVISGRVPADAKILDVKVEESDIPNGKKIHVMIRFQRADGAMEHFLVS
jgi:hypothetical protein